MKNSKDRDGLHQHLTEIVLLERKRHSYFSWYGSKPMFMSAVSNKLNRVRCIISSCLRGENDKFLSDEKVKQQSWQNYEQTTFTNILCLAICVVSSLSSFKQVATRNILVETKEQRLGGGGRGGVKRYEKSRTRRAVCRIEGKCCAQ